MSTTIFRAGTHRTMDGRELAFSEADLAAIAASYDPAMHEAPVVIGHPKTDDPAMGWVSGLRCARGRLEADFRQLDPAFAEAVNAGRYRHVSAAFYAPDSPRNPKPGGYYLRHVGALGAMPPSVKGLGPLTFAEDDTVFIAFSEDQAAEPAATHQPQEEDMDGTKAADAQARENAALKAELEALRTRMKTEEAERRHADNAAFAENLVSTGRLAPAHRAVVVAALDALSAPREDGSRLLFAEEGEGKKESPLAERFRAFLSEAEPQVMFSEFAVNGQNDDGRESPLLADARRRAEAASRRK